MTMMSTSYPLGSYADKILQFCNETFSTMYHNIFKRYWHDGTFYAKMSQSYASTDRENGLYEFYVPTRDDPSGCMAYYRIAVKVVPELDSQTARQESLLVQKPMRTPMGYIDSELIALVTPKLKSRGFIRGFRHKPKKGYLTASIITKVPEIAFKRLLTLIQNFLERRIKALLETLDIPQWKLNYKEASLLYYVEEATYIIERFSHAIASTIRCFSHSLSWVKGKIKSVLHEIGVQNMTKLALKPLKDLPRSFQIRVLNELAVVVGARRVSKGDDG